MAGYCCACAEFEKCPEHHGGNFSTYLDGNNSRAVRNRLTAWLKPKNQRLAHGRWHEGPNFCYDADFSR